MNSEIGLVIEDLFDPFKSSKYIDDREVGSSEPFKFAGESLILSNFFVLTHPETQPVFESSSQRLAPQIAKLFTKSIL